MKRLVFLLTFFFSLCIFYTANAQKLVVVILDKDNISLAIPTEVNLAPLLEILFNLCPSMAISMS